MTIYLYSLFLPYPSLSAVQTQVKQMEVVQIAQYENYLSDENIEENNLLNTNERVKKKKGSKYWVIGGTFDNFEEAETSIEKIW